LSNPNYWVESDHLVKIHGNWCGPNWTGGRKLSAEDYAKRGYSWNSSCTDALDCACRNHDRACSHPKGCSKKADTALIKVAKEVELKQWENERLLAITMNPFSSRTERKKVSKRRAEADAAALVVTAITLARLTRRH